MKTQNHQYKTDTQPLICVRIFLFFLFALLLSVSYAQEEEEPMPKPLKNTFFAEMGGVSPLGGFHYERVLVYTDNQRVTAGVGYSIISGSRTNAVPARIRVMFGANHHFLQLEKGMSFYNNAVVNTPYGKEYTRSAVHSVGISYAYRGPRGLYAQAGITSYFSRAENLVYPNMGVGYSL
jgi:hypothetical protein